MPQSISGTVPPTERTRTVRTVRAVVSAQAVCLWQAHSAQYAGYKAKAQRGEQQNTANLLAGMVGVRVQPTEVIASGLS